MSRSNLQDQHPELQAFSLKQHQEKVLAIESQTYTKVYPRWAVEKCLTNGYAETIQQSTTPLSDRITKISLDTKTCL